MKTNNRLTAVIGIALVTAVIFANANTSAAEHSPKYCKTTAKYIYGACHAEVRDDYLIARANCINLSDNAEQKECVNESKSDKNEAVSECRSVYRARLGVCAAIGQGRYDPEISDENFVDPNEIGSSVAASPFFPLVAGNTWVYEGDGEKITVVVTDKVKVIEGVRCRVVTDTVEEDGKPVEITDDWYAQDLAGNVWYFGEISMNFETFEGDDPEDAELVDIDGSWKTGRDGAKPGVIMFAEPVLGTTYRQELFLGDAEDVGEIVSVTGSESTPGGSCSGNCLVTRDFTPLEPGVNEFKYYAPGIGQILEIDSDGNRIELISFSN